MKGLQKLTSFAAGISVLALVSVPTTPMTAVAAQMPVTDIDASIVRAAAATPATGAVSVAPASGEEGDDAAVKCLVKWFEPTFLGSFSWDDVVHLQAKLICNDTVGNAELLIEQNDQIVVAQTVSNDQTEVSMLSTTAKLIDEQADTFCVAIARAGSGDTYSVVDQECFHFDFHDDYSWDGKGQE